MAPVRLSIGVIAWNEEDAIQATLGSIFQQSLFAELRERDQRCEILCVTNGCTDATPALAARVLEAQAEAHPFKETFSCRALDLEVRGKINAWNQFVHALSAREAETLVLMDGDIVLHGRDTLWNLVSALAEDPEASVSTDQPIKDISFKPKKSVMERISLATSAMTRSGDAQLTGQLYAIRAATARNIYLPLSLMACEDGFIKGVVCTDFLTRDVDPRRIVRARDAAHVFEAYTSPGDILGNQKRQMIGQTVLHVLDRRLRALAPSEKARLAETLREMERADPLWLKRLIGEHLRSAPHFWQLFPGIATFRFKRLARMAGAKKVTHLPAAALGFVVTMIACSMAHRFLKQGYTEYWPDTKSRTLKGVGGTDAPR